MRRRWAVIAESNRNAWHDVHSVHRTHWFAAIEARMMNRASYGGTPANEARRALGIGPPGTITYHVEPLPAKANR